MARIRSLHPGQWTDEEFVACSPLARLLALGVRNEADDGGVFEWKPLTLKMRLLPADNCDLGKLLAELEAAQMVRSYTVDGRKYGAIRNFCRYQRPKKPSLTHPRAPWVPAYVAQGSAPDGAEEGSAPEPRSADGGNGSGSGGGGGCPFPERFGTGSEPVSPKAETGPQMEETLGGKKETLGIPPPAAGVTDSHARAGDAAAGSAGAVAEEVLFDVAARSAVLGLTPRQVRRRVACMVRERGAAAPVERALVKGLDRGGDVLAYAQRIVSDEAVRLEVGKYAATAPPPEAEDPLLKAIRLNHEMDERRDDEPRRDRALLS